jgi:hypothetical protein
MEGSTTFLFVTDGIESALAQAKDAAAGKDVSLGGGATAVQQYLAAGLLEVIQISLVPVFLGDGARLSAIWATPGHGWNRFRWSRRPASRTSRTGSDDLRPASRAAARVRTRKGPLDRCTRECDPCPGLPRESFVGWRAPEFDCGSHALREFGGG